MYATVAAYGLIVLNTACISVTRGSLYPTGPEASTRPVYETQTGESNRKKSAIVRGMAPAEACGGARVVVPSPTDDSVAIVSTCGGIGVTHMVDREQFRWLTEVRGDAATAAFLPERRAILGGTGKEIRVFNPVSGTTLVSRVVDSAAIPGYGAIRVATTGKNVVVTALIDLVTPGGWRVDGWRVYAVDTDSWEPRLIHQELHAGTGLAMSPDGELLALEAAEGGVRLLSAHSGAQIALLEWNEENLGELAFSMDGKHVIAVPESGIVIWDVRTGKSKQLRRHPGDDSQLAISPRGDLIAVAGETTIRLLDGRGHKQVGSIYNADCSISSLVFDRHGEHLLIGCEVEPFRVVEVTRLVEPRSAHARSGAMKTEEHSDEHSIDSSLQNRLSAFFEAERSGDWGVLVRVILPGLEDYEPARDWIAGIKGAFAEESGVVKRIEWKVIEVTAGGSDALAEVRKINPRAERPVSLLLEIRKKMTSREVKGRMRLEWATVDGEWYFYWGGPSE